MGAATLGVASVSSPLAIFFLFFLPGTVAEVVLPGASAKEVVLPGTSARDVVLPDTSDRVVVLLGASAKGVVLPVPSAALPGGTTSSLLSITPPQTVKNKV